MRNDKVFSDANSTGAELMLRVSYDIHNINSGKHLSGILHQNPQSHVEMVGIRWEAPQEGFVALNYDGAVQPSTGMAATGGVLCDSLSHFLFGFSCNHGVCSVLQAELLENFYTSLQLGLIFHLLCNNLVNSCLIPQNNTSKQHIEY